MSQHRSTTFPHFSGTRKAGGFTLVEMLVALAVTMLLLSVIMVPLRMAFEAMNTSRAKSEVQQAAQATMKSLEQDLRRAIKVYPNTRMVGVTDRSPYLTNGSLPYTLSMDSTDIGDVAPNRLPQQGICDVSGTNADAWGNPSRIDLLLPRTSNGTVMAPVTAEKYLVTYYARREDMAKPFDPYDNPVVLYRAQYAYQDNSGADYMVGAATYNAEVNNSRYSVANCALLRPVENRSSIWLSHNFYGEANLEALCGDVTGVPTAHTLATPRGMALNVRNAQGPAASAWLQPDTSFVCKDTNQDGKIDKVTVNLGLVNYGAVGATARNGQPVRQLERYSLTVDLPNVK